MNKLQKFIDNPWRAYSYATGLGLTHWVPDELHLKAEFRASIGKRLDLDNPKTFNEKLQWLKLHDRNPLYTTLVDKYAVKGWVAERIGAEHVTPTYGVWENVEDINLDDLPKRFVLKTNHDCGGIAICRDRSTFDFEAAKKKLSKHLKRNYYWGCREWPYKDVKPLVFAEEYLEPAETKDLTDYKLFRFTDGKLITLVCEDRLLGAGMKQTFFDEEWHPLICSEGGHPVNPRHPRPKHFDQMAHFARKLGEGMPFVRVDFYESSNKLYFGEMTYYPKGGFECFDPASWDEDMGQWIDLSQFDPRERGGGGSL